MRWYVGRDIEIAGYWSRVTTLGGPDVPLTTGSPTFRASMIRQVDGERVYDDGTGAFSTTPTDIPLGPFEADIGFRSLYTVPEAARGNELTFELSHPDHPVVIYDSGGVYALNDPPTNQGEVEFLGTRPL